MELVTSNACLAMRPNGLLRVTFLSVAVILGTACKEDPTPRARAGSAAQAAATSTQPGGGDHAEVTPRLPVPQAAEAITEAFANAAKAIRPSVVRIDVEMGAQRRQGTARDEGQGQGQGQDELPDFLKRFFDFGEGGAPSSGPVRATGSGVIIDSAGHIITNAHVVQHATKVTIILVDGKKFPGKVVGKDLQSDIGVVEFASNPGSLTTARIGNSDQLRVGQWVLAVGSPLGMDQSVTAGIVSGLGNPHSRLRVSERARGYIQTDANINPGNSGGPLVNLSGEVVGINTMINVGPGGAYGFAIPVSQVSQVSQTLIKEGRVRYPYLGVNIGSVDDLSPEERQQLGDKLPSQGAVVAGVVPGGPAAQAGLKPGDVITRVGDRKVESAADVIDYVTGKSIGSKVHVEYVREGKQQTADVTLRELPSEEQAAGPLGMSLQTLTDPLARSLGIDPATKGAVVADVSSDGPAARAGLRPGDVIVEVDRKQVASAEAAEKALRAGGKKSHLLRVVGPGGARFVTLGSE
jgi:serine protease Do